MHAPEFWQTRRSLSRVLLLPFSLLYYAVHLLKFHSVTPHKINIPVICIGNITVGGTGKTPTVAMLVEALKAGGRQPHIISRGYSGTITDSTRVQPHHTAKEVGDEPLLLAQHAPCWVGKNRVTSATLAECEGADIIIMDDGFQNPLLHKDMSLIVIDGAAGFGNQTVLPAGPLRETLSAAVRRADGAIIIGEDKHHITEALRGTIPLFHAIIKADFSQLTQQHLLAFCGIGRPQKFYDTLLQAHYIIEEQYNFPDHHHFTDAELTHLQERATLKNAQLVTTEKDWLRLSDSWKLRISYIPIQLEMDVIILQQWLRKIHA